jgi:enoyl-CoA hydratase/carnithine racemase
MHAPRHVMVECVGSGRQIGQITLSRPDRGNAINAEMARELGAAIGSLLEDAAVRAIVITGSGKNFCPGADAREALDLADRAERGDYPAEPFGGILRAMQDATLRLFHAQKPTIAAINGSAAAGGLDLALACDFRIAADGAKFAESYVRLALPPLNGSTWLLSRAVGNGPALRLLLTGETITAEEAAAMRLVDKVVPEDEVLVRAIELAEQVSAGPADVVAFIKAQIRQAASSRLEDALAASYVAGVSAIQSESYRNAVRTLLSARAQRRADG